MARDPREIITPEAFAVAPDLIGTRLASPWRRGAAMLIDLVAIGILNATGGVALGLLFASAAFRMAIKPPSGRWRPRWRRIFLGGVGGLVLAGTVSGMICQPGGDTHVYVGPDGDLGGLEAGLEPGDVVDLAVSATMMENADSAPELQEAAHEFGDVLLRAGTDPTVVRRELERFADEHSAPWAPKAIAQAIEALALEAGEPPEDEVDERALVVAYAQAVEAGNDDQAAELAPEVRAALSRDVETKLQEKIANLKARNKRIEDELEEERDKGLITFILKIADELGLGLGWSAFYFTFLLLLWRGQTLGKRLLAMRVVRLDGKPMSLWVSFNRFGGYAASIFTGLLGFAEMFWDRNRQALHDRISSTVVVHEGKPKVPWGPSEADADPPA